MHSARLAVSLLFLIEVFLSSLLHKAEMTVGMLKYVLIIFLFYSVSFEYKHVSLVTQCTFD